MFDREYVFYGKHAEMVEKLKAKLSDEIGTGFFETNYDIYRVAPIVGYIYNRQSEIDKAENTTKVFGDKMMKGKDELTFNYRLIMMLALKKSPEEIANITFRLDDKDEERKEYDKLYNSYVLGGIEEIYERIFGKDDNIDDYIMNMFDFVNDLNVRIYNQGIELY